MRPLSLVASAVVCAAMTGTAFADTVKFTLSDAGGDVVTLTVPTNPSPVLSDGTGFLLSNVIVTETPVNGSEITRDEEVVFHATTTGAYPAGFTDQYGLDLPGQILFSGSPAAPVFGAISSISLISLGSDFTNQTFTGSAVVIPSATTALSPEPTSLLLLGSGLCGVLGARRKQAQGRAAASRA